MPEVSRVEAVCLSMNICPQHAQEDYGILDAMRGEDEDGFGPRLPDQDAAAVFRRRMFISRHLGNRVKLKDFVKFTNQMGWEIPTELAPIVAPLVVISPTKIEPAEVLSLVADSAPAAEPIKESGSAPYPNIENETRTHVDTHCAAFWLNRKEQTLRTWASTEKGPIRPVRINGRLAWSVAAIRELLKR